MPRLFSLCIAVTCGLWFAPRTAAPQYLPVSAEASVGAGVGSGGTYDDRGGPAFDLVLGMRLREAGAGALIGAVTAGVQVPVGLDSDCLLLPDGACAPDFPVFFSGGALLGLQAGSARTLSARVLAGPTYFRSASGALGLQARLDVASPPFLHVSAVASLRGAVLPRFEGETLGLTSFGLGLRIQ